MKGKLKFGIFIGYAPEQPILNQGLGRMLAFILQGLYQQECDIVIAMPLWYRDKMQELFDDFRLDTKRIEWLTTSRIPFLLKARNFLGRQKKQKLSRFKNFIRQLPMQLQEYGVRFLRYNIRLFSRSTALGVFLLALYGLLALVALPVAIVVITPVVILQMLRKYFSFITTRWVKPYLQRLKPYVTAPLRSLKNDGFVNMLYQELRANEFEILINKINKRTDIKSWLIPTLFWPEVEGIKAKKVMVVPDVVYVDFPVDYAPMVGLPAAKNIENSLSIADHFICYSEHVKSQHLIKKFAIPSENITVVTHSSIDCRADLRRGHYVGMPSREAARTILRNHMSRAFAHDPFLRDFDLANSPYFIYTSQIRPHKNVPNLIKAYEKLLREELVNAKLILTGDIHRQEAAWLCQYIPQKRLQYDIFFIANVSSETLAALNHLAVCSVNPTLFEGGFPFTFSEAYSVGTPSIMGRIPIALETIVDEELRKVMLFDPFDVKDMCGRMKWAYENRNQLFEQQADLYQTLSKRTWKDVAAEYMEVLESAAQKVSLVS